MNALLMRFLFQIVVLVNISNQIKYLFLTPNVHIRHYT